MPAYELEVTSNWESLANHFLIRPAMINGPFENLVQQGKKKGYPLVI